MIEDGSMKITGHYVRGVGVGLIIAWATSALAYWKAGASGSVLLDLIALEFILSLIFLAISMFMKGRMQRLHCGEQKQH